MKGIIIFLAIMFLTGCSNGMNFSDYTKGLNNAAENVEDGVKGDMKRFGNDMMNMADGKTQKTTTSLVSCVITLNAVVEFFGYLSLINSIILLPRPLPVPPEIE